jgi:broad specificity phosphatase PhoE
MITTDVILVRHGQTQSNVDSLLHGHTDVALTPVGLRQAVQVAERLAGMAPIDHIASSPLQRAWVTAETIGKRLGIQPRAYPALTEFDFGEFEGLTLATIQHDHPELFRRVLDFSDVHFRFPNGESRREFHLRVLLAVERIVADHFGRRIIVVAHGGVIGSAVAQLTGGDPNDWAVNLVENCSVTHLTVDGSGKARVECLNDVAHLASMPERSG